MPRKVAKAEIWVGLGEDAFGVSAFELYRFTPAQQSELMENDAVEIDGLRLEAFFRDDEPVGFGVKLISCPMGGKFREIKLEDLLAGTTLATKLKAVFGTLGINAEPKMFLSLNYS